MAQHRQSGAERFSGRAAAHDFGGGGDGGLSSEQISIRIPQKPARIRRSAGGRHDKGLIRASFPTVAAAFLLLGLVVTIFAFHYLSRDRDVQGRFDDSSSSSSEEERVDYRPLFNRTVPSRELRFGQGSVAGGRDSRYWDRDDRRRDDEYDEDGLNFSGISVGDESGVDKHNNGGGEMDSQKIQEVQDGKGLYNEAGRNELRKFEEKYKESLNNAEQLGEQGNGTEVNALDEYDDGIDLEDELVDRPDDQGDEEHQIRDGKIRKSRVQREVGNDVNSLSDPFRKVASVVSLKSNTDRKMGHGHGGDGVGFSTKASGSKNKPTSKGRQKRRSSCEMKLLDASQLLEPLDNKKFSRFSLQYTQEENRPVGVDDWEPRFAGHQSLQERKESFYARDQKINCGFVRGPEGSPSTGFDLAEDDMRFMSSCHIAVSSCIFGNSDHLRTPYTKTITRSSRKNVCFVMFMDEITLQTLSSEGQKPDSMGFIGLWKVVVVKKLPFDDMRRVGKVPKFLAHRLFPSARYSIWLDSKLRLQRDPLLILEYFLWRKGYEYAISNHYDRHCVWEEVLQNKKLNKFNHTIIDEQFAFYQTDGLKRFDPLDPNRLLPSYVPEGSFIMRAHTPMSNLFSCLWFNEVDRFTPRDQLSFAYTYLKLRRTNPEKPFHLHMFKDCERRSIAKLFRHRGESKRSILTQAVV